MDEMIEHLMEYLAKIARSHAYMPKGISTHIDDPVALTARAASVVYNSFTVVWLDASGGEYKLKTFDNSRMVIVLDINDDQMLNKLIKNRLRVIECVKD